MIIASYKLYKESLSWNTFSFLVLKRVLIMKISITMKKKENDTDAYSVYYGTTKKRSFEVYKTTFESGAIQLANKIASSLPKQNGEHAKMASSSETKEEETTVNRNAVSVGELIFTGTGSAVPCKHRNVTGIYLRMNNGNAIMLDIGEGTTGLLLRSWKHTAASRRYCKNVDSDNSSFISSFMEEFHQRLRGIKAIWISHPHADHHLGLLRLLAERNALCGSNTAGSNDSVDPVVLIAPPSMFRFLSEYSTVDPSIAGSYTPLDCRDILPVDQNGRDNYNNYNNQNQRQRHPLLEKLKHDLGVTNCTSVPVSHCAHSYAVVIDGTSFGRVAYSGDCRPSDRFADVGYGADLLIHEATFEDGMEEEAVLKRHCTVGEALTVGKKMFAKSVVLTHFSQRYPRIPPLSNNRVDCPPSDTLNGRSTSDESCSKRQKLNENESRPRSDDNGNDCNEDKSKETSLQSPNDDDVPVVFAFDFMTLKPSNVRLASRLTTAVRLLYPDDSGGILTTEEKDRNNDDALLDTFDTSSKPLPSAKELLAVPGAFAAKGVL
mmetsp:Transcript_5293/g.7109  ORF Transcript_5293/g.7109 Transcript_5293/m.7109 type:complete len:548 (+) Transcript_5293:181-1824(+)